MPHRGRGESKSAGLNTQQKGGGELPVGGWLRSNIYIGGYWGQKKTKRGRTKELMESPKNTAKSACTGGRQDL